ncbi:MAG: glycosyltransferase [Pseudomonadota bacterium]
MTAPRVLLYVQHLLGVGHVQRAARLSRALVAQGADVHVAFGGMPVPGVSFAAAEVHQLLPTRARDAGFSGLVDAEGLSVDEAWWTRRAQQLVELVTGLTPDAIVTEHFPFGRRQFARELVPVFEQARTVGQVTIASSVRDILVTPADSAKTARMIALAQQWFDVIYVHADPDIARLEDSLSEVRAVADRIVYTGYVTEEQKVSAPGADCAQLSPEDHGAVLVAAGGGAVGMRLYRAAMAARIAGLHADRRWRFLIGSNVDPDARAELAERAPENVIVEPNRADYPALLAAAGLSISQAGYNTMLDLARAGCPAIVVPFAEGGETEQALRAAQFAARGIVTVVPEEKLDAAALATALADAGSIHRVSRTAALRSDLNSRSAPSAIKTGGATRFAADLLGRIPRETGVRA